MISFSTGIIDSYSDFIDTCACAVFGMVSLVGTAWLILNLASCLAPAFTG